MAGRASAEPGGPPVVVEIGAKAEHKVDPLFTRRLMQLELSDLYVPARGRSGARATLFYRVLETEPNTIRVELWELGDFYGARSVNVARGASQFHARRIALAAAELARELRQARLAQAAEPKKPNGDVHRTRSVERVRLALEAGAHAAVLTAHELALAGPELGVLLRFDSGAQLGLRSGWLFGNVPDMKGRVGAVWRELALSPAYTFRLSKVLRLGAGFDFGVAALHVTGGARFEGDSQQIDTWGARAAFAPRIELALARDFAVAFVPELGASLRRIPIADRTGEGERLGGPWLGLSLRALVGPALGGARGK